MAPPSKKLNDEEVIDAALTLIGAAVVGDEKLMAGALREVLNGHPDTAPIILWKFASEISIALIRGNPGASWPEISEGLRNHWRQEGHDDNNHS
jgi:hypothetical protein